MMDCKGLLIISVICMFFVSCKKNDERADDSDIRFRYFNLEKQGWKSKKYSQKVDNIDFTATEVPIQYYLLKDKGSEDLISVDSLYEENKTERVIEFTFQDMDEDDLLQQKFTNKDYKDSVEYMSFAIQNDFLVVTSKNDTIKCSGVLFERNFKIAPFQRIMLFFSGIKPDDQIQLIYNDVLFNKGLMKFRFNTKNIDLLL